MLLRLPAHKCAIYIHKESKKLDKTISLLEIFMKNMCVFQPCKAKLVCLHVVHVAISSTAKCSQCLLGNASL